MVQNREDDRGGDVIPQTKFSSVLRPPKSYRYDVSKPTINNSKQDNEKVSFFLKPETTTTTVNSLSETTNNKQVLLVHITEAPK